MNRWMPAFESQLKIITKLDQFLQEHPHEKDIRVGMMTDRAILKRADPYFFSAETCDAIWQSHRGVPLDTNLDGAQLPTDFAYFYFAQPLPLQTTNNTTNDRGVRAIAFGHVSNPNTLRVDGTVGAAREVWGSVYVDDPDHDWPIPSQTWTWQEGEEICHMIGRLTAMYQHKYGPGGEMFQKYMDGDLMGVAAYVKISVHLTQFIVAASAWMSQRVVTSEDGTVERHRRKEMERTYNRSIRSVKVIDLPRRERYTSRSLSSGELPREYSHRWTVDGHWRNARVGVGREQRRLTYVHPHVKGPDDKPLIIKERVFIVKGAVR